jgi:hypothetical protein
MPDFEKLGVFYLGKKYDLASGKRSENDLILYDSKDLVTHAVCVGMTGSGKTGLCLALLEEAAIDNIPAIVIDPKGDLGNLLLTFPQLRPEDFRPWVNEDDARRKGVEPDEFARQQAELWSKGLAGWQQDGARIQKLRDTADFSIYTPGSNAGLPVSILKSFSRPSPAVMNDAELFNEQIRTNISGLLGLVGVEADPMTSREHILLSNIVAHAWRNGVDLDLAGLITAIQQPPIERVGVFDLESFFPQKDRFGLAMRLNNLLAAPGFENWMNGEALDIAKILYTPAGKPRIAIFSIAHLSDAERMFFVSLLLNQVLGWVRTQSGTTSLRALVYMDEIFGYFPPVQNPPSKEPLLTLLKQARAFGVGVVLATQNPVDLDYKGLANAGTWFIGRLQTERDKMRVLDGLESAAANASSNFNRDEMEKVLSSLGNRVFLMNNVHEDGPVVFETRWVMSYLRGPLQRGQIKTLMDVKRGATSPPATQPVAPVSNIVAEATTPAVKAEARATSEVVASATMSSVPTSASNKRPLLPPEIPQYFLPTRGMTSIVYEPRILGTAEVFFDDKKSGVMVHMPKTFAACVTDGPVPVNWDEAEELDVTDRDFEQAPRADACFAQAPAMASKPKSYATWSKTFVDMLYRTTTMNILRSKVINQVSRPGETEGEFRVRLGQMYREKRDLEKQKLQTKYASKIAVLEDKLRRAQQTIEVQQSQASSAKLSTAISFGATVLGALFGRKTVSSGTISGAGSTARGMSRSMKESGDVARAQANFDAANQQLEALNQDLQAQLAEIDQTYNAQTEEFESLELRPKKSDVKVKAVVLGWVPQA